MSYKVYRQKFIQIYYSFSDRYYLYVHLLHKFTNRYRFSSLLTHLLVRTSYFLYFWFLGRHICLQNFYCNNFQVSDNFKANNNHYRYNQSSDNSQGRFFSSHGNRSKNTRLGNQDNRQNTLFSSHGNRNQYTDLESNRAGRFFFENFV
jgi:hypothetical protein